MNYTFNDIAGYNLEKEELKRLCDIFNNRERFKKRGAKLPKGIIFYGEPGTGKTLFSKVLASECGLKVLSIDLGDVKNESEICGHIKKIFLKASKRKEPTMVFFDEMDKVLPNTSEEYYTDRSKTILTQLLTLLDGMDSSSNIIFVATCNRYNNLPEVLTRPGRLDKKIGLGKPNFTSRVEILKKYIQKSTCKFLMDVEELAKLCAGLSCSGIETLINECTLKAPNDEIVDKKLITEQIAEIKLEDILRESSGMKDKIFAVRNVGAFVVAKTYNAGNYVLDLDADTVCNDYFNTLISDFDSDYTGVDEDEDEEYYEDEDNDYDDDYEDSSETEENDELDLSTVEFYTKNDFIKTITVLLGGAISQELLLGKIYENVLNYYNIVDDIILRMFSCGMFGINLRFSEDRHEIIPYSKERIEKINVLIDEITESCYKTAKTIVENNIELIENLANVLCEKQTITKIDAEELISEFGGIK